MLPDRVSNPGPLTYESGALLIVVSVCIGVTLLKVYVRVFLCYGQGTVGRAILHGDKSCLTKKFTGIVQPMTCLASPCWYAGSTLVAMVIS